MKLRISPEDPFLIVYPEVPCVCRVEASRASQ